MPEHDDTIVAISTPPGRGGIGIIRLSGPAARTIAEPLLKLRHPLAPAQARFAEIIDSTGETLDEAVVTFFEKPHSYTSEDIVEIAAHGSPVLLDHILRQCIASGARLAEPGEFTQRAFLSGRLDLTQAEAVSDLIDATTLHQARIAAQQLGGSLSRQITPIKQQLIALIAALEAGIDFAEDDIDTLPANQITAQIAEIQAPLAALEKTFSYGRLVRDGFTLAIVGRPNAGKSSLFNRLIERDRAIVTASPGTTRDLITERVSLQGIPVELIDTAGLRDIHQRSRIPRHREIPRSHGRSRPGSPRSRRHSTTRVRRRGNHRSDGRPSFPHCYQQEGSVPCRLSLKPIRPTHVGNLRVNRKRHPRTAPRHPFSPHQRSPPQLRRRYSQTCVSNKLSQRQSKHWSALKALQRPRSLTR